MKKVYSLRFAIGLIFFLTSEASNLKAQMVYLPDTNFRNALTNNGLGTCITGDSIDAACPNVVNTTSLNITGRNIVSIEGIQVFTNLQILDCYENDLTFLPPLPASLTNLDCSWNQLTSLPSLPTSLTWLSSMTSW